MKLNFDMVFDELYSAEGLNKLNDIFREYISNRFNVDYEVHNNDSASLIFLAKITELFIAELFDIKDEIEHLTALENELKVLYECKRKFVQRYLPDKCELDIALLEIKLKHHLNANSIDSLHYAKSVLMWLENEEIYKEELSIAAMYARYMVDLADDAKSPIFRIPKKIEFLKLVDCTKCSIANVGPECQIISANHLQERNGFKDLPNSKFLIEEASNAANYCLFCHERKKDSCRSGIFSQALSKEVSGCPLDQKISEMNYLKSKGHNIAALSIITIDNPMCAATGHRICNDCMKACIFQKQDPVNVPGIETNILNSVLALPYGFEIYSLLTKWNPLKPSCIAKHFTNHRVLIVGLGPAGFTSAHYLLNEGHTVVAIDSNKIEPLPCKNPFYFKKNFAPIKNIVDIFEDLDSRIIGGFGGVAEYGITVRWNKNYLKLIRILLERRENFRLYGSTKFGSNINLQNFYSLGFQHLVLAIGAGSPHIPNIKNLLLRGMRFASDFLMSLHLGGAFKKHSINNLQIRMPIVVIGGGLTAIDVATEALEYYKLQVERFSSRYSIVLQKWGEDFLQSIIDEENKRIVQEFLLHARELAKTKNKIDYLHSIGGVKIIYYKNFEQCNSYTQNHEEIDAALKQGIEFIENLNPVEFVADEYSSLNAIKVIDLQCNELLIPAKTVLLATGTQKASVDFEVAHDCTLVGDVVPQYSGSVVKAMASAKNSYKHITQQLKQKNPERKMDNLTSNIDFLESIDMLFRAKVFSVEIIAKNIVELVIHAPLAAKNFSPGQFYKLQNYETESVSNALLSSTKMLIEPLALTGAMVNKDHGLISLIVLEYGLSSKLCKYLQPGEYVSLMGPLGEPTEIKPNENVLLLGGGLGNAVLFSIGIKMRSLGCKVNYIAGYKNADAIFKHESIEAASDCLILACEEKLNLNVRDGDRIFHGNIIEALVHYATEIDLSLIDRVIVIGSNKMMHEVQKCFCTKFKGIIKPHCKLIASINSPMQCMMQGLCGQCLQQHQCTNNILSFTYSCKNQDQNLTTVDFDSLNERLKQNNLFEIITDLWYQASFST